MSKPKFSLDDKYALDATRAYMTGIEALVRLPMLQHQRDLHAGLNTAGFISGYRGSPLGSLDQTLWKAEKHLKAHNIVFQPGVNEDLAATAVWGSQQVNLFEGAKYDGVFGMWYGKGPGVDRSMDVIKHANAFGTSKYGGVLAIAGDDHSCKSSSLPHQSEHMFMGASIPVLNPANVQEVLDLGVFGWELSRYSGCWVALKAITENMDSAIAADIDPSRVNIVIPDDFTLPAEGLHGRWPSTPLEQERILNKYRIYAARNFARVNKLDKIVIDSDQPRLGIITTGKAYLDVLQAFDDLGIDENKAREIGLRVFKVGMSWPLEPVATHEFAKGLEEILVVEEKRSLIEDQLTGQLYNWPVAERPRVFGEFDENRNELLTNLGELTPAMVARAIASRISRFYTSDLIHKRLDFLEEKENALAQERTELIRKPHYCSGCPHNTSTVVPKGSRALAGIGCHYMVMWMDRNTNTFTQMGGEGASWIGQAPFTETKHVFQNLGDGTYFHSGLLAIRATINSGVNITYKILYNDAVAMTGGQPVDGQLSVGMLVNQVHSEGVNRIAVVSDDPKKYPSDFPHFPGLSIHHRDALEAVQREFREITGTSVIIYDQTCAAEKRRRRKKKLLEDPAKRVFINEAVCEGCGDCSVKSNCLSVLPKETEWGRKRVIDQSACNKDYSCLKGFCPSFVTVTGGKLRKKEAFSESVSFDSLPDPVLPHLDQPWNILVTGIGGTGVLTVGAVIAMAAYIEGKGCSSINQTGLAQKFGAVISHVRIGKNQEDIHAARIAAGDADLLLGCDLVVSESDDALAKLHKERSYVIVNDFKSPTSDFLQHPDMKFPLEEMKQTIQSQVGSGRANFINATELSTYLLGDSIASNMFLTGYAFQKGLIPVSDEAINEAIALNGVEVEFNQNAFLLGRRAAHDITGLEYQTGFERHQEQPLTDVPSIIDLREDQLVKYQNRAYALRYRSVVEKVFRLEKEQRLEASDSEIPEHLLSAEVARNLCKLMAYKDEYEVARLFSDGSFIRDLEDTFEGDYSISFHLAAPLVSRKDKLTGNLIKRKYPAFTLKMFSVIARFKFLRGSFWDVFSYSDERKEERALIEDYCQIIDVICDEISNKQHLDSVRYKKLLELASLPKMVRGYGHIKLASIEKYYEDKEKILASLNSQEPKKTDIPVREIA